MPLTSSAFDHLLGRFAKLEIRRFATAGAFLAEPGAERDAPVLLLLGPEIPSGAREGDELDVFVYQDSQDRPIATTQTPRLALGEVTFLQVTARTQFGAFVDWGLPKELLVPFAEQTVEPNVGGRYAIGLYLDDSGRLAGTMRVAEMLRGRNGDYKQDEWVDGEAWRYQPEIGLFVIVERSSVALVPDDEPQSLKAGDRARFRITNILPDGKMELSLRGHAHEQLADDAQRVLAVLREASAELVGDHSSPAEIRELFGLSKKAFKRAVGRLLRQRAVEIDGHGYVRLVR
jgi:hypothetical protein